MMEYVEKHDKERDDKGNGNATHRKKEPGMKSSCREVKSPLKSSKMCECVWVDKCVREAAHAQATY